MRGFHDCERVPEYAQWYVLLDKVIITTILLFELETERMRRKVCERPTWLQNTRGFSEHLVRDSYRTQRVFRCDDIEAIIGIRQRTHIPELYLKMGELTARLFYEMLRGINTVADCATTLVLHEVGTIAACEVEKLLTSEVMIKRGIESNTVRVRFVTNR